MTRRRKLLLSAVAALGVAGVLAQPAVHWRLLGWVRGEPFYDGRPASYWRGVTASAEFLLPLPPGASDGYAPVDVRRLSAADACRDIGWHHRALGWAYGLAGRPYAVRLEPVLPPGDPAALPVLLRLLEDAGPQVRLVAALAVRDLGPEAAAAAPALRRLTSDDAAPQGFQVGALAADALRAVEGGAPGVAARP